MTTSDTFPGECPVWRDRIVTRPGPVVTPTGVEVEGDVLGVRGGGDLVRGGALTLTMREPHRTVVIVDFGHVVMGHVEIEVTGDAPVRCSYAEFRRFADPAGDGMGSPFGTDALPWSRVDVIEATPEPSVSVSPGKRELRYVAITLDAPGTATISFLQVRQTTFPVRYDGHFLCNDELLNEAWYQSAHAGDLATVSEDGSPWMLTVTFDRVLFMGDLHLQALAGYQQSSDHHWLMARTLRRFVRVQFPDGSFPAASSHLVPWEDGDEEREPSGWTDDIGDAGRLTGRLGDRTLVDGLRIDTFTAFWVAALADHLRFAGDHEFARSMLAAARRATAFLIGRLDARGLYVEPPDRRTDPDAALLWVANWSPSEIATGADAFGNAVVHEALDAMAFLEEEVGDPARAAEPRRWAERVREGVLEHLWDDDPGALVLNDRDPLRDHTGDANAGNLVFGVLDDERAARAMSFLRDELGSAVGTVACEHADNPFRERAVVGYLNAMEALGRVRYGDLQGALDLIRTWWGHMLRHGPGTGWYNCRPDGSVRRGAYANSSWTTAVPPLSEGVLGVRPLAPGFSRWVVAPQLGDLTWAQGRVPVPGGTIAVRWRRDGDGFAIRVEADRGVGTVAVPQLGRPRSIYRDGRLVWCPSDGGRDARAVADAVHFSGVRGHHTWTW